mmetsp:Transcript_31046/g.68756  ORF Transcript_31046/g.68756 Transcript_31046/m.68756 type:complete len:209 (+) Transcript_31046:412-1038(+)
MLRSIKHVGVVVVIFLFTLGKHCEAVDLKRFFECLKCLAIVHREVSDSYVVDCSSQICVVDAADLLSDVDYISKGPDCFVVLSARKERYAHFIEGRSHRGLKYSKFRVGITPGQDSLIPELGTDLKHAQLRVYNCDIMHDRASQLILDAFVGKHICAIFTPRHDTHILGHCSVVIPKFHLIERYLLSEDDIFHDIIKMVNMLSTRAIG